MSGDIRYVDVSDNLAILSETYLVFRISFILSCDEFSLFEPIDKTSNTGYNQNSEVNGCTINPNYKKFIINFISRNANVRTTTNALPHFA